MEGCLKVDGNVQNDDDLCVIVDLGALCSYMALAMISPLTGVLP